MKYIHLTVVVLLLSSVLAQVKHIHEFNDAPEPGFVERFISGLNQENFTRLSHQYMYETMALNAILFFLIFYQIGKRQNIVILNDWYAACRGVFEANFAHVGVGKNGDQSLFVQESPSAYKFYASGRDTIQFAHVLIELKKRQDIISNWLLSLVWPEKDRCTIDIPLFDQKEPICAAILRKKDVKTARDNFLDLKGLCQKIDTNLLDEHDLVLLAGDNYIANSIFDDATLQLLNQNQKYVSLIHITDQKVFSEANSHIRVVLNLPTDKNGLKQFESLLAGIFRLADRLYSVKLVSQSRADALKERDIYEQIKTKDEKEKKKEELAQEKEKKLREERDRIAKLGKDELQKYEDKQAQKELKKRLQKRTMKVM